MGELSADLVRPCWEIDKRWPKFCASLSNGHGRCRKGHCFVLEARQASLFDEERKAPRRSGEEDFPRSPSAADEALLPSDHPIDEARGIAGQSAQDDGTDGA